MSEEQPDTRVNELLAGLRVLAVRDPKKAREALLELVDQRELLESLFSELKTPKESRVRHLVVNTAMDLPPELLNPFLKKWSLTETDEFTRRSILQVLNTEPASPKLPSPGAKLAPSLYPVEFAEMYSFIATRIKYRLANGLLKAHLYLSKLLDAIESAPGSDDLHAGAVDLKDEFRRWARVVEAVDLDAEHFDLRAIKLREWIHSMNSRYASQYSPVGLRFSGELDQSVVVIASNYLLETVFWNIWLNSHQVTGNPCEMDLKISVKSGIVTILVQDNGPGFPEVIREVAFKQQFSTNGANRGRGLLEIEDGVRRLQGKLGFTQVGNDDFRLHLSLPLDL